MNKENSVQLSVNVFHMVNMFFLWGIKIIIIFYDTHRMSTQMAFKLRKIVLLLEIES